MPRIIQLAPNISAGDAVSNDIFAMADVLTDMGRENLVVAIAVNRRVTRPVITLDKFSPEKSDIFLYHMSIGSALSEYVINADVSKKLMVYHNITPAHFFKGISALDSVCKSGRDELADLSTVIDFAICDSDYNRRELYELGYVEAEVLPIMFDKSEYTSTAPSVNILQENSGNGYTNILFVGRIAPNKRQEDIIAAFALYNKYINKKSRLFLVGAVVTTERYQAALERYVSENNIENVHFEGHVSFSDIIAYYKIADLFLCESEHEGFCVPLLEAMIFDVPIVAYASSAVGETLGGSGIVFTVKSPQFTAELMDKLLSDELLRKRVIENQRERLLDFGLDKTKTAFKALIEKWL